MRCWRITTLQNVNNCKKKKNIFIHIIKPLVLFQFQGSERGGEESDDFSLELSFEYLIAKNQLQWITVISEQAILMSVCLQAMIDELLSKTINSSNKIQVNKKKILLFNKHSYFVIIIQLVLNIKLFFYRRYHKNLGHML